MSVSVNLSDDLASRLFQEAECRQMTLDELAVGVLTQHIPAEVSESAARAAMRAFIGIGASDDTANAASEASRESSRGLARRLPFHRRRSSAPRQQAVQFRP